LGNITHEKELYYLEYVQFDCNVFLFYYFKHVLPLEKCRRELREDNLFDSKYLHQLGCIVKPDLEKLVRKLQ